jgi:hypothetical protein
MCYPKSRAIKILEGNSCAMGDKIQPSKAEWRRMSPENCKNEYFVRHDYAQKRPRVDLRSSFDMEKVRATMKLWPRLLDQNIWLERTA